MKRYYLAIVILITGVQLSSSFSLQDAVQQGLEYNHGIRISKNKVQQSANRVSRGNAGMLPSVSVTASERLTSNSDDDPLDKRSINAGVAVSWTVFDGFKMFRVYNSLKVKNKLAEDQSRGEIELTIETIIRAYLGLVTNQAVLNAAMHQVSISKQRLEQAQTKRDIGGLSEHEFLKAKTAYNEDLSSLNLQELQFKNSSHHLNLLLGYAPEKPLSIDSVITIPDLTKSYAEWLTSAQEYNSGLSIREKQRRLSDIDLSIQRSKLLPTLTLSGGYEFSQSDFNFSGTAVTSTSQGPYAGISAYFSIFNGFKDQITRKNLKIEQENTKLSVEEYKFQLESMVYLQFDRVENAYKQVGYDEEGVALAQRQMELVEESYKVGGVSSLEFRDAQLNLVRAQNRRALAKLNARMALTTLGRLAGEIGIE